MMDSSRLTHLSATPCSPPLQVCLNGVTDVYDVPVYKVLVTELLDDAATHADLKLDQLLRNVSHVGGAQSETLIHCPKFFSIHFVWEEHPSREDKQSLCDLIAPEMDISKTFDLSSAKHEHASCRYSLRALVCYHGKHYITFVKVGEPDKWRMLDDARITEVGRDELVLSIQPR